MERARKSPDIESLITSLDAKAIAKLDPQTKSRLREMIRERQDRVAQCLFDYLYTDDGVHWPGPSIQKGLIQPGQFLHSWKLYPKHMEFFEAGGSYTERASICANRCITPWTYVQTPGGEALSAEVWTSEGASVLSWDGVSQCASQPQAGLFLGIEPAFRVVLDSGRFFDCNRRHRVLASEGWLSLDQLVSLSSGLRYWQTRANYQANCVADGYLGDRPLRSVAGIDLAPPPSLAGAQARAPLLFEQTDEVVRTLQYIHTSQQSDRLSTRDDLIRFAGLFALFSGASSAQSCLSLSESSLAFQQLAHRLAFHFQQGAEHDRGQFAGAPLRALGSNEYLCGAGTQKQPYAKAQALLQSCDYHSPGNSTQEFFRGESDIAIFYPSSHPQLVGGETIRAIVPLGLQPIIDAHVPPFNNYLAGGVVQHNTGKTFGMGGYETACHLTGLYPHWWKGRRFDAPVSAWAAGKTLQTTRNIMQLTLLGTVKRLGQRKTVDGRGVIPGRAIIQDSIAWRSGGVSDLVDTVLIKHVSGGYSDLGFLSYDQGRGVFEGTGKQIVWLDEEPPADVYSECLTRTATTKGMIYITFTPLEGLSSVVLSFLPGEQNADLIKVD